MASTASFTTLDLDFNSCISSSKHLLELSLWAFRALSLEVEKFQWLSLRGSRPHQQPPFTWQKWKTIYVSMYVFNICFDIQPKIKDQTWFEIFTFPFHMWIFIVGKKDLLSWVGRLSQSGMVEEAGGTKKTTNGWTLFAQLHIFAPVFLTSHNFVTSCWKGLLHTYLSLCTGLHLFGTPCYWQSQPDLDQKLLFLSFLTIKT